MSLMFLGKVRRALVVAFIVGMFFGTYMILRSEGDIAMTAVIGVTALSLVILDHQHERQREQRGKHIRNDL